MCHVNAATEADRCNHLNSQPPRRYCCETQNITVIQPRAFVSVFTIYTEQHVQDTVSSFFCTVGRYTVQVLKFLSPNAKMQNGTVAFTVIGAQAPRHIKVGHSI